MSSGNMPLDPDRLDVADPVRCSGGVQTLQLHEEQAVVSRRVRRTQVRVATTIDTRSETVAADLNHDRVVVDRVPIGRVVDAIPEIRQEADLTILPVVEEEIVVTRRLILREEVHVRRVRTTERHVETLALRREDAVVTRTGIED